MRKFAMLVASAHICLAACQPAPGSLLPPPSGPGGTGLLASAPANTPAPPANGNAPTPYMRCANDFWGNCTGVASNRQDYRWRYVRPGARPKELRESATARASTGEKAVVREKPAVREKAAVRETVAVRDKAAVRENAVLGDTPPVRENAVVRETPAAREKAPAREKVVRPAAPREKIVMVRDNTIACHPRRRVVGDERPSQDDARRAAENGWMGAVRYDYGERYQDINRAKDVRLNCGPSSVSAALRTPFFRCAVEATPCRETKGHQTEPDERRYDPPVQEDRISRK